MIGRAALPAALLLALLPGCGLETALGDAMGGGRFTEYVPAPDVPKVLRVRATGRPGAKVEALGAQAVADPAGEALLEIPAAADLRFAIVRADDLAALVPPGASAVALDDRTTADVRLALALPGDLAAADGLALMALLSTVRQRHGDLYDAVLRSLLGLPADVDAAVSAAAEGRALTPCLDDARVRVVFQAEMRDGMRDGNCAPIERFRWAADDPDAALFIAGDLHEGFGGIDPADAQFVHERLAAFAPNQAPLAEVAEGLWQAAFDLPRTDPPLRLGYKYTWGLRGAGWTGTEEWPGNQRLLEVVDVNGDGLVVRRDRFGDETTNKDRQNLRRGALGVVKWDTDADGDGWLDAREGPVDRDGDCVADGFPAPVDVAPPLGDCAEPAPPPEPDRGGGPVEVREVEGRAGNGGGALIVVRGAGFDGAARVAFGGVPAPAVLVRGPDELVAVAPRLPAGEAEVTVGGVAGPPLPVAGPRDGAVPACRGVEGPNGGIAAAHAGRTRLRLVAHAGDASLIAVEAGLGPGDTDPAGAPGWTFWPARRAAAGAGGGGPQQTPYEAEVPAPGPGAWAWAFRASADGGRTWRYCDDPGSFVVQ